MNFFINIFCSLIILTAFAAIFCSNIMISILFLILMFIFTAVLYIILGVEFLSFLLFIVYVGAIAILFLFVIMLLHIRTVELYHNYLNYLPIGCIIGLIFFVELFMLSLFVFVPDLSYVFSAEDSISCWAVIIDFETNIHNFGDVLFNVYHFFIFVVSILLLLAMLISIVLVVNDDITPKDFTVVKGSDISFFSCYP